MKICIVIGPFFPMPPFKGGAVEKMWYSLGNYFEKKNHQIIYISREYKNLKNFEKKNKITHIRIKSHENSSNFLLSKYYDFRYSLKAIAKIPEDIDIIISNTFFLPILIKEKFKKKLIIDVQRMPKKQFFLYKKIARFRANSKIVYDKIIDELGIHYKKNVKLIPNFLENNLKKKIIKKFNYKILYTGRIHKEKGLEILIQAFKKIKNKAELEIIGPYKINEGGSGIEYFEYLKLISKDFNIKFSKAIYDKKKLQTKYKKASIFVYPSIAEGETFGVAPLEAMSYGCATIVSNLECFRDFIKNNKNGLTFNHKKNAINNLYKKLIFLIENKRIYSKISNNSQKVNKTHSLEKIGEEFLKDFNYINKRNI